MQSKHRWRQCLEWVEYAHTMLGFLKPFLSLFNRANYVPDCSPRTKLLSYIAFQCVLDRGHFHWCNVVFRLMPFCRLPVYLMAAWPDSCILLFHFSCNKQKTWRRAPLEHSNPQRASPSVRRPRLKSPAPEVRQVRKRPWLFCTRLRMQSRTRNIA